jgi:hypothetical protein
LSEVQRVVGELGLRATVVRVGSAALAGGDVGLVPTIPSPVQLLEADGRLEPLVGGEDGVLLGRMGNLHVLADPDVLASHGLHRGKNAAFALAWIEFMRPTGATVVVDAASQGRARPPSLVRELTTWPLSLPVATAFLAAIAWAAAGVRRFGAPQPPPSPFRGRARPLVEHAAALLAEGGHARRAAVRYVAATRRHVERRLHMPAAAERAAADARLDAATASRGGTVRVADLERAAAAARSTQDAMDTAARTHAWRTFFDGPRRDS